MSKTKLAVYTLTRDRLEYTKRMFDQLKNCGVEFNHFVLDNGSQDKTPSWLKKQKLHGLFLSPDNKGLWKGIEIILQETDNFNDYDLVLKLDNDMEFPDDNWLRDLVDIYNSNDYDILQPFILGIQNGRGGAERLIVDDISLVNHCAGGCLLTKREFYDFPMPNLGKAMGWDTWFCMGLKCGVVENIKVKHNTLEQEKEMPWYYQRKIKESKEVWQPK